MQNSLTNTASLFLTLFVFQTGIFGQSGKADPGDGIFDLLNRNEIMEITLETDMDSLMDRKKKDVYTDGRFTFERAKKQTMTLPVSIRARGKFRRMKCSFPPLKLKFKKNDLAAHNLNKFNELKLVTHCLDEREMSKELILREYLVYKMFNLLTPNSFRVQLVKVNYKNTGKKAKNFKSWGILIEDEADLAQRLGGEKVNRMGIPADSLDANQENLVSLFQFMVGNTDWSILLNRNVQLVLIPNGKFLVIPYDFDYSGVVSAPYARPDVILKQKSVKDRVFMGYASSIDNLSPVARFLLSKEEDLEEAIYDCPQLAADSKAEIQEYIHSFFDILEDEGRIVNELLATKKE